MLLLENNLDKIYCMTSFIRPDYYKNKEQTIELIELIRDMPFSLGNAIKYVFRCRTKEDRIQDLTKALWYLQDYQQNKKPEPYFIPKLKDTEINIILSNTTEFEHHVITSIYRNWQTKNEYNYQIQYIQREIEQSSTTA